MEEKLYDYMDWAEIEAVVYSEENHPRDILGPRVTEDGILIQAFLPGCNPCSRTYDPRRKTDRDGLRG